MGFSVKWLSVHGGFHVSSLVLDLILMFLQFWSNSRVSRADVHVLLVASLGGCVPYFVSGGGECCSSNGKSVF